MNENERRKAEVNAIMKAVAPKTESAEPKPKKEPAKKAAGKKA